MPRLGKKQSRAHMKIGGKKTTSASHKRLGKKRGGYNAVQAPTPVNVQSL